ncbi:MAG: hypothetical protein U0228_27375 [Myxococcaceae bacterium]
MTLEVGARPKELEVLRVLIDECLGAAGCIRADQLVRSAIVEREFEECLAKAQVQKGVPDGAPHLKGGLERSSSALKVLEEEVTVANSGENPHGRIPVGLRFRDERKSALEARQSAMKIKAVEEFGSLLRLLDNLLIEFDWEFARRFFVEWARARCPWSLRRQSGLCFGCSSG